MNETNASVGFFPRLLATIIDILILLLLPGICILIIIILANFNVVTIAGLNAHAGIINTLDYSYRAIALGFCIWCEASERFQGTPGKYLLKMKITNEDGSKLSLKRAIIRFLLKLVSLLLVGVGFFMILFSRKKLGLHDVILNTKVVRR